MGGAPRTSRTGVFVVLALGGGLSCAQVLGLDEPTVGDDGGGGGTTGSTTSSASTITASGAGAQGPSGTGGGSGDGGGDSAGGRGPGGSGGAPGCRAAEDCDDENPCTVDTCDEGECDVVAIPDGPLVDDPKDCRDVTCAGGAVVDHPDDGEDPDDANPPCETTICQGGAATPVFAADTVSCGPSPQFCDGAGTCIECDPADPDVDCGETTFCAVPSCVDPGVCDPGFLPTSTALPDPLDGDCQKPQCTGDSVSAISVADDGDTPGDTICGDGVCNGGAPSTNALGEGTPCNGEVGVCDGNGTAAGSCRSCRDTTAGSVDAGCSSAKPHCDEAELGGEGRCYECLLERHCADADAGDTCETSRICGCDDNTNCADSAWGPVCITGTACGCNELIHCATSPRGDDCIAASARCGCDAPLDCEGSSWGLVCIAGECGCDDDGDCADGASCDAVTNRCS